MESLLSVLRLRWDHEPVVGCSGAAVSAACAGVSPATDCGTRRPNGRRDARPTTRRFMESLLSLLRMHCNHEPTPNPSQEGNGQDADRCLFPSWEGSGVGRFMERIATAQDVPHVALSLGTGNMPPGTTRAAPGQPN